MRFSALQFITFTAVFLSLTALVEGPAPAQTSSPKCAGNLLATAVPQANQVNGYTLSGVRCVRGQAERVYSAGESEVTVTIIDRTGQLAGTTEARDPPQIVKMAEDMGRMLVDATTANADAGRDVIAAVERNPDSVAARGGPNYMPFTLPFAGGAELLVLVPTQDEAAGDFTASGTLRNRYMVSFNIKQARVGKDGPAARLTIAPFLSAMNFSQLP
jgi:hypothetical protein